MRTKLLPALVVLAAVGTFGPTAAGQSFDPRLGVTHTVGPGLGFDESFSTFEAFMPFVETEESLFFADFRGIWSNDNLLGQNFGLGKRLYSDRFDRMFGMYAYYDTRATDHNVFHQLSFGAETVGEYFDARANFYAPVNANQEIVGVGPSTEPFFRGNNILVSRILTLFEPLTGFDAEMEAPLPVKFNARGYVGTFGFKPDNDEYQFGVRGRVQAALNDNIMLNLAVQNDPLFGTDVAFQAAWYWDGFVPRLRFRSPQFDRLRAPVQRNYNVVLLKRDEEQTQVLTNPLTGAPIIVRHVNNSAPVNANAGDIGLGTFENPYRELFSNGTENDIIFVRRGNGTSIGYDNGIILQNGQRLLGDGIVHFVNTVELGTIPLPGFTPGPLPMITSLGGDFGNAVILAQNNEVAGFDIVGALNAGIFGGSLRLFAGLGPGPGLQQGSLANGPGIIDGFDIHDNIIRETVGFPTNINSLAASGGIVIDQAFGAGTIHDNQVVNNFIDGIVVVGRFGSFVDVTIENNLVDGNFGSGIAVRGGDSGDRAGNAFVSSTNVTIDNNIVTNNSLHGVEINALDFLEPDPPNGPGDDPTDGAFITALVTNNTIENNFGSGVFVSSSDDPDSTDPDTGPFIDESLVQAQIDGNIIRGNSIGISVITGQFSVAQAFITNNLIEQNSGDGIQIAATEGSADPRVFFSNITQIVGNDIINNFGDGINYNTADNASIQSFVTNNTIDGNFGNGVTLVATDAQQMNIDRFDIELNTNIITNSGGSGIIATINDNANGRMDIRSNTISSSFGNAVFFRTTDDASIVCLRLLDNVATLNGAIFDYDISMPTAAGALVVEATLATNVGTFNPAGFFTLVAPGTCGFPP